MKTEHHIYFSDSARMSQVASESVHLAVTSPPYPMIDMWDDGFCDRTSIRRAMDAGDGLLAFELMHRELDRVWEELQRVIAPGGIVCVNIGDATRTLDDEFALYPNHGRILTAMLALGFSNLPNILWRKPTNAPNKFMGSGMLPPGAYVTLEHEYILVFRKGGKRTYQDAGDKIRRRQSAYFWEERNRWFSDIWTDLIGTRQDIAAKGLRQRSAAFPFELAYRLVCMFSIIGDTVLDPFLGTGTTMFAAAAACRNSLGYEVDKGLRPMIVAAWTSALDIARRRIVDRLTEHENFANERKTAGKTIKYVNRTYGFPVITRQETDLMFPLPTVVDKMRPDRFSVRYKLPELTMDGATGTDSAASEPQPAGQMKLFD